MDEPTINSNNNNRNNIVTPERSNRFSALFRSREEEREESGAENIAVLEAAIEEERVTERNTNQEEEGFSPFRATLNVITSVFTTPEENVVTEQEDLKQYKAGLEAAYEESLQEIAEERYLHDSNNDNTDNPGAAAQRTGTLVDSGATAHCISNLEMVLAATHNPGDPADDNGDDSSSTSSTDSCSAMGSEEEKVDRVELKQRMEKKETGSTTKVKGTPDYAQFVWFRNAMGAAISTYECNMYDLGYAHLADTDEMYIRRVGAATTPPIMPGRTDRSKEFDPNKNVRKKHHKGLKHHIACSHAQTAGIALLEETYPKCLALLYKPDVGLPLKTTLKDALEHVQAAIDTPQRKREENLTLQKQARAMSDTYQHVPGSNSVITYLGQLEAIKKDIDALKLNKAGEPSKLPVEDIVMISQEAFWNGIGKTKHRIHDLNEEWNKHKIDTGLNINDEKSHWAGFKTFYVTEMAKLDEDDLLEGTTKRGRANSATAEENALLKEKVTEQGHDLCALQLKVDKLSRAGTQHHSVSMDRSVGTVPPLVETIDQGTTSRLGSNDNDKLQCQCALQDERTKSERQAKRI